VFAIFLLASFREGIAVFHLIIY